MVGPREINLANEPPLRLGSLVIRPSTRDVTKGERSEILEPRVMQVLVALARRRGEVVSRGDLVAACWGGRNVVDEAIRRCVVAIRRLAATYGGFSVTTVQRVGYRLDEVAGGADGSETPSFRMARKTPLVGRTRELGQLGPLLANALSGHGGMALISGEPGIGKTRLADEVGHLARERGGVVLKGHCYAGQGAEPFAPFVGIMEELVRLFSPERLRLALGSDAPLLALLTPELREQFSDISEPTAASPDQLRRQQARGLRNLLARLAQGVSLVVILDDLHWGDEATMAAIRRLAQQLDELPILVLGTYRHQQRDIGRPFAALLEELLRQRQCDHLLLRGLSEADTAGLVRALAGAEFARGRRVGPDSPTVQVGSIYAVTEGNPFYVEEVVRHLAEDGRLIDEHGYIRLDIRVAELSITDGVRIAIGKRLSRLSAASRNVLAGAAILGATISIELLAAMELGTDESIADSLDEAEVADLVSFEAGRHRFSHDLVRQAVVAALPAAQRRSLHQAAAAAIERLYPAEIEQRAAELGRHLVEAATRGAADRAVAHLTKAGFTALNESAFDVATEHFNAALDVVASDALRVKARLLRGRARGLRSLGKDEQALADYREAFALCERLADSGSLSGVTLELTEWLTRMYRHGEAAEVCERAVLSKAELPTNVRARLLATWGYNAWMAHKDDVGYAKMSEAEALLSETDDRSVSAVVLTYRALIHNYLGECAATLEAALAAGRVWQAVGDAWMASTVLPHAASAYLQMGRWDEAIALLDEVEPSAERLGNLDNVRFCQGTRGPIVGFRSGTFYDDRDRAMLKSHAGNNLFGPEVLADLGTNDYFYGRWADALTHFEEGLLREGRTPREGKTSISLNWSGLLKTRALMGNRGGVEEMVEGWRARSPFAGSHAHPRLADWVELTAVAEALFILGASEEVAALYASLRRAVELRLYGGFAGRLLEPIVATAAAAGRQWEIAERHFASGFALAERLPHKVELADTRLGWAQSLRLRGREDDLKRARKFAAEAASHYAHLGMAGHVELANQLIAGL